MPPLQTSSLALAKTGAKLLILLGLTMGLAACGQRGPLVPPTPNTNVRTDVQEPKTDGGGFLQPEYDANSPTKAPDEDFILDPLL